MRTKEPVMESEGPHYIYANISDFHGEKVKNKPKARGTKTTRHGVIMVLVILLILMFLLSLLLTGLVLHYKSIAGEVSHPNNNGSSNAICGVDWTCHKSSCYYFSFHIKTWMMAKKDCEDMGAHLVVINSEEEMIFIEKFSYASLIWIGLTDMDGTWKWVDGTSYASTVKFWQFSQPDNWSGHENGENEDCATILPVRKWNDDNCSRRIPYICEKKPS